MEALERKTNEISASHSEDPRGLPFHPDAPVDPGTLSTAEATAPEKGTAVQDASVVSAITDHASLEGALQHSPPTEETPMPPQQQDLEVPKQVILPEDAAGRPEGSPTLPHSEALPMTPGISTSPPPPVSQTLVITALPLDAQSAVSTSALPDAPEPLAAERSVSDNALRPQARSVSAEEMRTATPMANEAKLSIDSEADEYIRSPEVQNAIVERSPGGRYVRFMEKLGSGASKDVYRAYDTQEGIEVAWNVVTLSGVPRTERNRIINEVRLLERLHHQNIISFHGSWVNRERQEINFVTEILSSGTLKSFINKVQVIRWKIAKRWAVQILHGLAYLHAQDPPVIHRDLKCENIFINGTSGDLRIGDLGLSTVHRNGKVLSVLGTPEFMAPDMYEEAPYDEKVDIYAFGMCMLEIFTKEIPYSECNNPAQIYKKVSAGEPPEVLTRLESRHARDFVMLCLGRRDENGKYIRPSADELLKHPFLDKRATDDDEVIVERPLRERGIPEANESSTTSPNGFGHRPHGGGSPQYGTNPSQAGSDSNGRSTEFRESESMNSARNRLASTNSLDDDGNDHFEEMPESESNMKKVKVLIGRGQELKEDDSEAHGEGLTLSTSHTPPPQDAPVMAQPAVAPQISSAGSSPTDTQAPAHNYLVAAAVIGNEAAHIKPYADDILKLVVTLPVEGQTQNVQFDFHLVRDDPVKVAKEMVQELGIPQGAVLEISETISALACSARMKQDSHNLKMQQGQVPAVAPAVQPSAESGVALVNDPQDIAQVSSAPPPRPQGPVSGTTYAAPVGGPVPVRGVHSQDTPLAKQPHHFPPAGHSSSVETSSVPPAEPPQSDVLPQSYTKPLPQAQPSHLPSGGAVSTSPRMERRTTAAATAAAATERIPAPLSASISMDAGASLSATNGPDQTQMPSSAGHLGLSDEDDEDIQAELRRLEEEYERNLERAKKVFDSRMVNLQRSQKEKEKEHQKFLEKHEKERAEFEKRRALEEEQQQRRLEQLQKERDRKIQSLALEKKKTVPSYSGPAESTSAASGAANVDADTREWQGSSLVQSERSTDSWNQVNACTTQSERSTSSWNTGTATQAMPNINSTDPSPTLPHMPPQNGMR